MKKSTEKLGVAGIVTGGVLLVITAVAFQLAYGVLIVFMYIWNISDIQNVGVNFWNIFWLVLATIMALGFISSYFKRSK